MKKIVSLILGCAVCMSLTTPAFAATDSTERYTIDFGEHEIVTEELTFREVERFGLETEIVGVSKEVQAIHMDVGDSISFTPKTDIGNMNMYLSFYGWFPGDIGFSETTSFEYDFRVQEAGKSQNATIPNPIPLHNYLLSSYTQDDLVNAKYILECKVNVTVGMGESIDTEALAIYYIIFDSLQSGDVTAPADTAPATTTAPPTTADGAAYTVVKYDTLGQIALNSYGSYKYHTALYQVNAEAFKATGGALKPGMVLTLPDTLGAAKRIAMPVAGDGETLYTVKAGDTLGGIAKAVYGDVMKYQAIFERNSDRLTNANTIFEGQVIVLPAK